MSGLVIQDLGLTVPAEALTFAGFRRWVCSPEFPEKGRIDFLAGEVDIDMSPEDLFTHGTLKGALYSEIRSAITADDRGEVFTDCTRYCCPDVELSVEPDVVVLLWESVDQGRAKLVPKADAKPGRFIEIEGAVDLVVEVVSDSSTAKDAKRLVDLYARAGVREYLVVDARPQALKATLYRLPPDGGRFGSPVKADARGFLASEVLERRFRLGRSPGRHGSWRYRVELSPR
jgi:Uma2 family endonuclease